MIFCEVEANSQYSVADVITEVALEVVQSQLVLLQILDTCLTQSWRRHAEAAADYRPEGHHQSWVDPLPLDEGLARRILSVVISYLRLASSESSIRSGTTISATNRDGRGQVDTVNPWGYGQISQPTTSTFSPDFVRTHVHSRQRHENRRHQNSFGVHVSTIVDAVPELTRYLGQIVYYLSSSNWSLVFGRVRSRLLHLTTTIEDMPDLIDLRLLQWSNMNRARLGQVLQEGSTRFLNIKRPAQIAFATVLHAVIWNWLEINPNEFENLVTTDGRLEGNPDGLFDVLYSMSDFSSSNAKRTAVFYPLLSMLLVICPDMLKKVVLGETKSKSSGVSKKSSFMESLKKGLNSGNKGTEPSTRCYVNFVKAAVVLSPQNEGAGLRILLSEIVNDLKVCSLRLNVLTPRILSSLVRIRTISWRLACRWTVWWLYIVRILA
jgi:neurofibromin 1